MVKLPHINKFVHLQLCKVKLKIRLEDMLGLGFLIPFY